MRAMIELLISTLLERPEKRENQRDYPKMTKRSLIFRMR
jgi:hypothetical protein